MGAPHVTTLVIRWPSDSAEKVAVQAAMDVLKKYATAMSLEDEMSVLDFVTSHEDFDPKIEDQARERVRALLLSEMKPNNMWS